MQKLTIKTLGGITLGSENAEVRLPTKKASALLVYLAMSPRGTRSREHLASMLWGRSAEEQARASLRQTLSSLRKTLGDQAGLVDAGGESISIERDYLEIDVVDFQTLTSSNNQLELEQGLALYEGEFLEGFSLKEDGFEEWLATSRQQFHELALQVTLRLVEQYTMLQEYETGIRYAQKLLSLDPLQEQSHRRLIELYARLDRREHALRQYDECERILKKEFDVVPGPETRALYHSILNQSVATAVSLVGKEASTTTNYKPLQGVGSHTAQATKPGIAVLPFDNLSGDPSQQQLSDAITEDIVSNLAHDLWFDVIARTSTQQFRDNKTGIAGISSALGARYIVDGSLRKSGDRIRISVVLIDGSDARQIWSQRYDRVVTDIFELQDQIAISIAAAVIPELNIAEQQSAMRRHPKSLDAWSLCHKAFWHLYKFELTELELAQSLFEEAIEIDPSYSQPYAGLAYSQMMYVWYDSSKKSLLDDANRSARHAIQLDNRDSYAHFALGRVLSMQSSYAEAVLELETAIELNPSFGRAYFGLASVMVYSACYFEALEPIDNAIRLSPEDPHLWTFYNIKSRALAGLGRFEEAVSWGRKAVRQPSSTFWSDIALISALGHLERRQEAELAIAELQRKKPGYSCNDYHADDFVLTREAHELVVEGLRKAGLAED
jgi:DNA-binding SARP family transcriptional activator/Tfp pilus assembly protein PilF